MSYGSGTIAAHKHGAAEIVDPRSTARGSLAKTFEHFPWVGRALPAMGYSRSQLSDLAATIENTPCDSIVVATPVDLARLIKLPKPHCRVRYDLEEMGQPDLAAVVGDFLSRQSNKVARH
jgi:predicted GTPase